MSLIIDGDLRQPAHRAALVALINEYRADPMGGALPPLDEGARQRLIDGLLGLPTVVVLFAECDGMLVGMAVCFVGFSTFQARPLLNVHDLIVTQRYRGRGIGRELLAAVERTASGLGCCRLTLEVRDDNARARGLYRSLGYGPGDRPMEFWQRTVEQE